jgi:hypothetical protein
VAVLCQPNLAKHLDLSNNPGEKLLWAQFAQALARVVFCYQKVSQCGLGDEVPMGGQGSATWFDLHANSVTPSHRPRL